MKYFLMVLFFVGNLYATTHSAKVLETIKSGGYVYIKVDEVSKVYWIAMTDRAVKVGDTIAYTEQGWMQNFHSKTLNRTFENILFASDTSMAQAKPHVNLKKDVFTSAYQQAGTLTLAELFAHRDRYVGKKVRVRAKVTKVSSQIMKRNWVHLQDGTRFQNQDDLVFTTLEQVPKVGTVVIAEGVVLKDKDFGYGYFYSIIVEESTFRDK